MRIELQILGTGAGATTPSCLIVGEKARYLFNCGEGLQRFCLEHKVRIAKISHVFLTQVAVPNIGGLPGMLLTTSDAGNKHVAIVAPGRAVEDFLLATRFFMNSADLRLDLHCCPPVPCQVAADEIRVTAVTLVAENASPVRRADAAPATAPTKRRRRLLRDDGSGPEAERGRLGSGPEAERGRLGGGPEAERGRLGSGPEAERGRLGAGAGVGAGAPAGGAAPPGLARTVSQPTAAADGDVTMEAAGGGRGGQDAAHPAANRRATARRKRQAKQKGKKSGKSKDPSGASVSTTGRVGVDVVKERGRAMGGTFSPHFPKLMRFVPAPMATGVDIDADTSAPAVTATTRFHAHDTVACYIIRTPAVRGKFYPQRALALGVPKGPLFGRLARGTPVKLPNGTVIMPSQVMDPEAPSRAVLIVACPHPRFLPALVSNPALAALHGSTREGGHPGEDIACVVHFTPTNVVQTRAYAAWTARFSDSTHHIVLNDSVCPASDLTFRAQAVMQCKLNTISPRLFPLPHPLEPLAPAELTRLSSAESAAPEPASDRPAPSGRAGPASPVAPPAGRLTRGDDTSALATLLRHATSISPTPPPLKAAPLMDDPASVLAPSPPPGRRRPRMSIMGRMRQSGSPAAAAAPARIESPWARPSMMANTATGRIRVGAAFQADIPELVGPSGTAPSPAPQPRPVPNATAAGATAASPAFAVDDTLPPLPVGAVAGRHLLRFVVTPRHRSKVDTSVCVAPVDPLAVAREVLAIPGMAEEVSKLCAQAGAPDAETEAASGEGSGGVDREIDGDEPMQGRTGAGAGAGAGAGTGAGAGAGARVRCEAEAGAESTPGPGPGPGPGTAARPGAGPGHGLATGAVNAHAGVVSAAGRGHGSPDGRPKRSARTVRARSPPLHPDAQVVFLGTSSAVPHKYRNVSGILLQLPRGSGVLLDCGEGTYGQMVRRFQGSPGGVHAVIKSLAGVWISHMHADHHLGLLRVLKHRRALTLEPLAVVGPWHLQAWLQEAAKVDPVLRGGYQFVDAHHLLHPAASRKPPATAATLAAGAGSMRGKRRLDDPDGPLQSEKAGERQLAALAHVRRLMHVANMATVPVKHCYKSYGVKLQLLDGSTVVYSGDCKPSSTLITLGQGCSLLIHEATFQDGMEQDAKSKSHCTVGQALRVATEMRAQSVLLTHFSARYPKLPELGDRDNLGLAFDLMGVKAPWFAELQRIVPALQLLFKTEDEEDEHA